MENNSDGTPIPNTACAPEPTDDKAAIDEPVSTSIRPRNQILTAAGHFLQHPETKRTLDISISVVVFCLYAILVVILALRHEPFADEAQSWLLARDTSIWSLVTQAMHYEGCPPLWPLLIKIPILFGMPYSLFAVFSSLFGILGVAMLLWRSPLPAYLKILLPFTYFIFYQYSVISRNYVLMLPVLMWCARAYPKRLERGWPYALSLVLLAEINAYTFVVSACLGVLHLISIFATFWRGDSSVFKRQIVPTIIYVIGMAIGVYTLTVPKDIAVAGGTTLSYDWNKVSNVIKESWLRSMGLSTSVNFADTFVFFFGAFSVLALIAILAYMLRMRTFWLYVLPSAGVLVFMGMKHVNIWHPGILFVLMIFALYVAFDNERRQPENPDNESSKFSIPILRQWVSHFLLPILLIQVVWSIRSFQYDYQSNYSGAKAAAESVQQLIDEKPDSVIFGSSVGQSYFIVTLQPYFRNNIYVNYNGGKADFAYYVWSSKKLLIDTNDELQRVNPDVIVVSRYNNNLDAEIKPFYDANYDLVGVFDGKTWWKEGTRDNEVYAVFKKKVPLAE